MPVDPWATTTAQEFPPQSPPGWASLAERLAAQDRKMFDLRASVLANVSDIVADLTAKQAALAAQNAQILDLIGQQIKPAYGFTTGSAYAIPAGRANKITRASFDLTVPSGFTQALISASAQDVGLNSTAGIDYLVSFVDITATGGGGAYAAVAGAAVPVGVGGVSFALITYLKTGLTGGQTITISSQPYTSGGTWASVAANSTVTTATCLFLR